VKECASCCSEAELAGSPPVSRATTGGDLVSVTLRVDGLIFFSSLSLEFFFFDDCRHDMHWLC
jgi:hypothetical protein